MLINLKLKRYVVLKGRLINAGQIAKFSKKNYSTYIKKGFEFGLKPNTLKNYPFFDDVIDSLLIDIKINESYKIGRKKYLKNIDFEYLSWVYDVVIMDQLKKSMPNYGSFLSERLLKFRNKIKKKGFPSDRIIGIDDSLIFKEIGLPEKDLMIRASKHEGLYYKLQTDDARIGAIKVLLPFIHHRCSFMKLESIFINEIKKGNIHPRDVGVIYDNAFRFKKNHLYPAYCKSLRQKGFFRLNNFLSYPKKTILSNKNVDMLRKQFYIVSLKVDMIKKEYEKKYGFRLFSGFWNCR